MTNRFLVFKNVYSQSLTSLFFVAALLLIGCDDSSTTVTDSPDEDTVSNKLNAADFEPVENCSCHPDHVTEWSGSMHAYALKDPVFFAVRAIGQSAYVNALDQACVQCHSIIGSRSGEIPWGPFDVDDLSKPSQEGIGCDLCHTITSITRLANGGIDFTPGHVKYGTTRDPIPNDAHESEYNSLYSSSEYCGACHDFVTDGGLELETTFREWQSAGFALTGKTCNDCHMPAYTGSMIPGGPERTLHRHTFPGVDLALIDFPQKPEQIELTTELLQSALTLVVTDPDPVTAGGQMDLEINVINDKTGHSVPSGVPFNRQVWLEIVVKDAIGDTIYSSGQLDSNDDLMDEFSEFPARDADLTNFQASMLRADSVRTGATWEAVYLDNPAIVAGETRTVNYTVDVPPAVAGPLTVDVTLRFRSFGPYLFRDLGLESLLPIPIIDMAEDTKLVTIQ